MKQGLYKLNFPKISDASKPPDYSIFSPKHKSDEYLKESFASISYFSPYLGKIISDNPDFFADILTEGPDAALASVLGDFTKRKHDFATIAEDLRRLKKQASLIIALADIGGKWNLEKVTSSLSLLAKTCLNAALETILADEKDKGNLSEATAANCGIAIIGMGKLGADELNYSSDIDLILLFDPQKVPYKGNRELSGFVIKLAQKLVALIDEKTKDGYVFRTDLRIRPDPSSTPIIMSINAALNYYECFGKNWERAAMIKGCAIAGDTATGKDFMARIYPFVWRRSLDFNAIMDIKNIKTAIAENTDSNITKSPNLAAYNIKLGKGGIRDIEFFTQIQQLIWGGRNKDLQTGSTVTGLKELAKHKHILPAVADKLISNYQFLRTLEHRLQMIDDEQTHSLPSDPNALKKLAVFMNFKDLPAFTKALTKALKETDSITSPLFEDMQSSLNINMLDDDNSLLTLLADHNFRHPSECAKIIKNWYSGIYKTIRSRQSLSALSKILGELLKSMGQTTAPDSCLYKFDNLLRVLPSGVQLLPLFESKPEVMTTVIDIMGSKGKLSDNIQKNSYLIEDLINPDFFAPLPAFAKLKEETESIANMTDEESAINALQIWTNSQKFRADIHLSKGLIDGKDLGFFISNVAIAALNTLVPIIERSFARLYGVIPKSKTALLVLGKNGSAESTTSSDLDLIFIYDSPKDAISDGMAKKLDVKTYYSRFVQRIISVLTTAGKYGKIWQVDMRLRPSGNAGPLATSLDAFIKYQKHDAWTWEKMALTKASKAYGDIDIEKTIKDILCTKNDPRELKKSISEMRQKIIGEHPSPAIWDLKNISGGMTDIEFISQYLQLRFACEHPEILQKNTTNTLIQAKKLSLLPHSDLDFLITAYKQMLSFKAILSLNNDMNLTESIKEKLLQISGDESDFAKLEASLTTTENKISNIFNKIIGL